MCVCCYDVARESGNWKYSHGREKVEIYEVGQKEPWGADSEQFPSPFPSYAHTQSTNNNHSLCCLVAKSCLILCDPTDCSTPGSSVLHYVPQLLVLDPLHGSQPCHGKGACVTQWVWVWGHPRQTGHSEEFWQTVVHRRRKWQLTSVFLLQKPHEKYEKV